jgi:6-pyruvoyltetrahydropterin/6-carboxytetrahydropterin synthase
MYSLAIRRDFIAQHYLIGGDWGAENQLHSHHYQMEIQVEGDDLDGHGYLIDIVDLEARLSELVAHYQDRTINDLPEFSSLNPSIEHFSRILCQTLAAHILRSNIQALSVRLWENEIAWAGYRLVGVPSR